VISVRTRESKFQKNDLTVEEEGVSGRMELENMGITVCFKERLQKEALGKNLGDRASRPV